MRIKVIPIGQMLMLTLLIMLIGIGITAILKKTGASSKVRKKVLRNFNNAGLIIAVLVIILGIVGLFNHISFDWSLYPWKFETLITIKLAIFALLELGITAVILVVFIAFLWLVAYVTDRSSTIIFKITSWISEWYRDLTK